MPQEQSSNEEYLQAQQTVLTLAHLVLAIDLREFLRRIDLAETIGIFHVTPMEYKQGTKNLESIKGLAEALIPFQKEARKIKKQYEEQREKIGVEGWRPRKGYI